MPSTRILLKSSLFLLISLYLSACGKEHSVNNTTEKAPEVASSQKEGTPETETQPLDNSEEKPVQEQTESAKENNQKVATAKAQEISWDALVPADYDPYTELNDYIVRLNELGDNDQEALELYGKIQAELDNAPVNMEMDGKMIKMPGFIAPLENNQGVIDQFLLVPYFGACIHTPAPPINQTVMVKTKKGEGIKSEESDFPVWITGKLVAVEERTNIGAAGYRIENPFIEPYGD